MLDGKYKPGEAVVRVKTDMTLKIQRSGTGLHSVYKTP